MKTNKPADETQDYCETEGGKWVRKVRAIIAELEYGDVQLTVHEGKVVEIRKVEKIRLNSEPITPSPKRRSHS